MKYCPKCGTGLEDNVVHCTNCGTSTSVYTGPVDPFDHTAEFDAKDISENKVICMLVYLAGYIGILVALLMSSSSKYVAFHVRQALKIEVVTMLGAIVTALLFWTVIVPIAAGILAIALFVVKIICFFQICSGKAKEPAIICNLKFMK